MTTQPNAGFLRLQEALQKMQAGMKTIPPGSGAPPAEPTPCEMCGGAGWVVAVYPDGTRAVMPCTDAACAAGADGRQRQYAGRLRKAGIPAEYSTLTFETFMALPSDQRAGKMTAAAACYKWSQGGAFTASDMAGIAGGGPEGNEARSWVVLQGGLGIGKTGLASAACTRALSENRSCLFYRLQSLFSDVQARYGKTDGDSADDLLMAVQRAPMLILDECNIPAKETSASADKTRLFEEIIRSRAAAGLPTMLTMNADQAKFSAQWGERTADVIAEKAHWIRVGGAKLRRGASVLESV